MYCMKCGKEIKENQVFCDACLVIMGKYPVKPGTYIQIPQRPSSPTNKAASRRKSIPPEEQVLRLRRRVKSLALSLVCCLLALGLTVSLLVHTVSESQKNAEIGKNYNTVDTAVP